MKRLNLIFIFYVLSCAPRLNIYEQMKRQAAIEDLLARGTGYLWLNSSESLESARAVYELGRELRPGDARVYDGLGSIAWRKRQYREARDYFETAISLDPGYSRAVGHLAMCYAQSGDVERATELYQRALSLNPQDSEIRNNYAALLFKTDSERSRREFLKAVESSVDTTQRRVMLKAMLHR